MYGETSNVLSDNRYTCKKEITPGAISFVFLLDNTNNYKVFNFKLRHKTLIPPPS